MLITIEGIDGAGKTTLQQNLEKRLKNRDIEVLCIREPGGTKISESIRSILLNPDNKKMHKMTEAFLFSAARRQIVDEIIEPAIKSGKIVICDRFYDSTIAYQGYGRGLNVSELKILNDLASNHITPDITFLIHIDREEAIKRIKNKNKDRMESDDGLLVRAKDGYLMLAKQNPERIIILNGVAKPDELAFEAERRILERM